MPGSPLKRQRKAGVTDPVTGERIQFPRLTHPRAGLSYAEWRALSPSEKLERLFGMSLDDLYEIMSWEPIAELDPARLAVRMQVTRTVFTICMKAVPRRQARPRHCARARPAAHPRRTHAARIRCQ
jgi:hypothetical protein